MNKHLLILSGGVGSRYKATIPKQYTKNNIGESIIYKSILPFIGNDFNSITIVADKKWWKFIEDELKKFTKESWKISFTHEGKTRQDSIDNGTKKISDVFSVKQNDFVFIQEAVRPFVSKEIVNSLIKSPINNLTVSPVINPIVLYAGFDHKKQIANRLINKSAIVELQMPKRHNLKFLIDNRNFLDKPSDLILDETEIFTNKNIDISIVKGTFENVKITYPMHRILVNK